MRYRGLATLGPVCRSRGRSLGLGSGCGASLWGLGPGSRDGVWGLGTGRMVGGRGVGSGDGAYGR